MSLKITLKPGEKVIIGGAVIMNGGKTSHFFVENTVPILREKDILSPAQATSPCRRIYLTVQLMYIDEKNLKEYHTSYWEFVRDVVEAAPSTLPILDGMSELILSGNYYQALKRAKKLIEYEEELLSHARKSL